MENNNLNELKNILENIIYNDANPTVSNTLEYRPTHTTKQIICFNNQIVEIDKNNTIINPESICKYINFDNQEQLITIRYIPQDNGDVIKYSVDYNKTTGATEYKICNIQQKEKQQFFTTELNNICVIKQLIDENEQNNTSSIFEDMLNNNILQHTTNTQLNFNIRSNGKVDIKNINGLESKNYDFIKRLQKLENLSKSESNWEIGKFGTNAHDLHINLVANSMETFLFIAKINEQYLSRLRLIDWDNNIKFNKEYLETHGALEIKHDLDITKNNIIPLCHNSHASLIMSDKKNNLYQYNTGSERTELNWLENKCTIEQRGQCCGYSIQNFILHNKKEFNIDRLKQNDRIINKKIIEYSKENNFDATDYFIKMNKNIAKASDKTASNIEKKQIFFENCFYIQHVFNTYGYKTLEGREQSKNMIVNWNKDESLKTYKNNYDKTHNKKSMRNGIVDKNATTSGDIFGNFKEDVKNKLKEIVKGKEKQFINSNEFRNLGTKDMANKAIVYSDATPCMTDQEISQQVRKNIQAMIKDNSTAQHSNTSKTHKQKSKNITPSMTQNE